MLNIQIVPNLNSPDHGLGMGKMGMENMNHRE
jgi:hypothetical protein